ncbi:MAG TPA: hypothetical protein VE196_03945, partial [Pseudonocardiaceae bacterium]|nr:hypothetical protein [Pseudonocardiaceae bacterium]
MAIEGVVWLNPDHGGWLRELGLRGFQLVWASSWGVRARDWIAPRLGLPADLAVIEVPRYGPGFGWSAWNFRRIHAATTTLTMSRPSVRQARWPQTHA